MKKQLILCLAALLCIGLLAGCGSSAADATAVSATSSLTPIPTTPPDATSTPDSLSTQLDEDAMAVTHDNWVYYLDINDAAVVDYNEDPPLHRMDIDGGSDESLEIRGFRFDIIGDYVYVDSNNPDLNADGTQTWGTTRMGLDGSDKIMLEFVGMSVRVICEDENRFCFTTLGDGAIYISDVSCEYVNTLIVTLPDKAELDSKIGADNSLQLSINEVAGGAIDFDATFSNADGLERYNGNYKMSEDGNTIEKIKGEYYSYGSQENE